MCDTIFRTAHCMGMGKGFIVQEKFKINSEDSIYFSQVPQKIIQGVPFHGGFCICFDQKSLVVGRAPAKPEITLYKKCETQRQLLSWFSYFLVLTFFHLSHLSYLA